MARRPYGHRAVGRARIGSAPIVRSHGEAARRAQCTNNLKQIGLAFHNYHSPFDRFPPAAITGKDGKPLLSWRVAILPYLEAKSLYDQFHLDEPWDSPHNKPLAEKMPPLFTCPSGKPQPGMTPYRVVVGSGAAFEGREGRSIAEFTDGTSLTGLVVEAREAVPATKPDEEIPLGDYLKALMEQLGSPHPCGFNLLFTDGSVRFLKRSIDPKLLRALFTRSGGEVVDRDKL